MEKIKIDNNAFIYPMPMTVVGSVLNDKENYMAVGWVSRVNFNPPMIGIALGKNHATNEGIHKNREFSVNVPSRKSIETVDYVGLVTAKAIDKSKTFQPFYGELKFAPMIQEFPVTMECRLFQAVDLPSNTFFIGEIVGAYAHENCLTDGKPDIKKIDPFTLTMPDCNYWAVGENIGKAWSIGKSLKAPK